MNDWASQPITYQTMSRRPQIPSEAREAGCAAGRSRVHLQELRSETNLAWERPCGLSPEPRGEEKWWEGLAAHLVLVASGRPSSARLRRWDCGVQETWSCRKQRPRPGEWPGRRSPEKKLREWKRNWGDFRAELPFSFLGLDTWRCSSPAERRRDSYWAGKAFAQGVEHFWPMHCRRAARARQDSQKWARRGRCILRN
jgi:hypothetical protein